MRSRVALVLPVLVLLLAVTAVPLYAQETDFVVEEAYADFFTLSAGWSWPVGGPVKDSYQSGFVAAASFRAGLTDYYLGGLEFGYRWYSLDTAKLEAQNPGSTFSGGDMGLMSITTENDYIFGVPGHTLRPFFNAGLGFYRSFIDDTIETTETSQEKYETGVYKGSFFGFHLGIGALVNRDRFGLRIDANYEYLFAGGPNLEFFTARLGFIFYTS